MARPTQKITNSGTDLRINSPTEAGTSRRTTMIDLANRALILIAKRELTKDELSRQFNYLPDIKLHLEIFQSLAPLIDVIFIQQYRKADGKTRRSWLKYAQTAGKNLKTKILKLLKSLELTDFWHDNPETKEILEIVGLKLLAEQHPQILKLLTRKLEKLAVLAYQKGKVVWLVSPDHLFTRHNLSRREPETPFTFEADLRLIAPFPVVELTQFNRLTKLVWKKLVVLHPGSKIRQRPQVIFGRGIGVAGAQIFSSTSGESLKTRTIVLEPNMIKHGEEIKIVFKKIRKIISSQDLLQTQVFLYLLHEFGHRFYKIKNQPLFEELATDITAVIGGIELLTQSGSGLRGLKLINFILTVFGESLAQAFETPPDGYVLSGKFMVNQLLKQELIVIDGQSKKIKLNLTSDHISTFLAELSNIHRSIFKKEMVVLNQLKQQRLNPIVKLLLTNP